MESAIPKETETIAVKRSKRLANKLIEAKRGLVISRAWWSNGPLEIVIVAFILGLNFFLIYPLFGTAAFETSFSGPVIPFLALFIKSFGVPLTYAIQIVNLFFFLGFLPSFYYFVKKVSDRKLVAFLAVLIVSLPFSPFAKSRIMASFFGIEGPHVASLALIPIALATLLSFLRQGEVKNLIFASFSSALVALTSPFGFMTYLIFAGIVLFSEILLGRGRVKLARFLGAMLFSGGLCSFWYNPAFFFWMILGPLGEEIREMIVKLIPLSFFSLPVLATFGYLLFDRKPGLQPLFLASFYFIAFSMIVWAGGEVMPAHPSRYLAEFGLSLAFLVSVALVKGIEYLAKINLLRLPLGIRPYFANFLFLLMIFVLTGVVLLGRRLVTSELSVLGMLSEFSKGSLWLEKDKFASIWLYLGYAISGITILILAFLGVRTKKENL